MIDPYHQIIVNTHIKRFHQMYSSYFNAPETRGLSDYFFERIYSLEDKNERDALAMKTYNRFKGMLSEKTRERIEHLLYLNELTDELDLQMAEVIQREPHYIETRDGVQTVIMKKLPKLYHEANSMVERTNQLKLVVQNLESFFELSKHPMADLVMKPAGLAARMVGAKKLFKVFEEGYHATRPVRREVFFDFTRHVRDSEINFLEDVYKSKIHLV